MQKANISHDWSTKRFKAGVIVKISILSVLAYIFMLLEFPIPIFPAFLKIDLSDVPPLIGAFALGPVVGVFTQLVKVLLFFVTRSQTGGVGELANFIIGVSYVVPASIIYHRKKDKAHALIGTIVGTIVMCIVGILANLYIMIPFYSAIIPIEAIVNMGTVVNSRIVDVKTLVLYGITPFNLLKGLMIAFVTLMIYKKISPILKR